MKTPHIAARMLLPIALLASNALPAMATQDPSRWSVSSFAGQAGDAWVANLTIRNTSGAYEYQTERQLLLIDGATGCIDHREVLTDNSFIDSNASGDWTVTSNHREEGDFSLLVDIAPPVPSDWAGQLSLDNGALMFRFDGAEHALISADQIAAWAALQSGSADGDLRLVETYESVDAWRGDEQLVFVELETSERSIDVDYSRFVVPVSPGAAIDMLLGGTSDPKAFSGSQPVVCQD